MDRAVGFIKTAGIYFLGNILTKMISFLLLPLYTNRIAPNRFGEYDLNIALISFFIPVIFLQVWDGMFRFAFDKNNKQNKYNVITNSFFVFLFGVVVYFLIYMLVKDYFNFRWLIFIYGITFALQYQYSFIARVFLNNKLFVFSGFLNSLVSAILNVILIVIFDMGIESLYISFILGVIIQVIIIEIAIRPLKNLNIKAIEKSEIIKMIRFSIPLCVATISYWLLSGYTKLSISNKLGAYENGLYAVAGRFSVVVSLVISIFQYAWNEMAYKMANDDDRVENYKISIEYITKAIIIGSSISILVIKIVFPYIVSDVYSESLNIIPLSLIGVGFNSLASFVGTIFMTEKNTKSIFITTVISASINIACMNIFIELWGLQGAIASLCLSFVMLAIIRIVVVRNLLNIKDMKVSIIYVIILLLSIYAYYTDNIMIIISVMIGIALFSLIAFKSIVSTIIIKLFKGVKRN